MIVGFKFQVSKFQVSGSQALPDRSYRFSPLAAYSMNLKLETSLTESTRPRPCGFATADLDRGGCPYRAG